jgi:hypothetical protein
MSRSSAKATNAATTPIASASPEIGNSRVVAVKSASTFHDLPCSLYPDFLLPGSASVSVGLPKFVTHSPSWWIPRLIEVEVPEADAGMPVHWILLRSNARPARYIAWTAEKSPDAIAQFREELVLPCADPQCHHYIIYRDAILRASVRGPHAVGFVDRVNDAAVQHFYKRSERMNLGTLSREG